MIFFSLGYDNNCKVSLKSEEVTIFSCNLLFYSLHPVGRGLISTFLSNSNISKTVRINIAFIRMYFEEYSISFLMICRLILFALVVLQLLMFKFCGIIGISKSNFSNFSGTERVKQTKKKSKNFSKPPKLVSQSLLKQYFFGFSLKF